MAKSKRNQEIVLRKVRNIIKPVVHSLRMKAPSDTENESTVSQDLSEGALKNIDSDEAEERTVQIAVVLPWAWMPGIDLSCFWDLIFSIHS